MKVLCDIETGDLVNEKGREVRGVLATCEKCGHQVESYGTGERSIRRCLALMRDECPLNEENYYEAEFEE